ncbi:SRPBCC family protein [Sporosarcina sp. 179-K 3D1 HS]|uniref:SRPBCC family protein n=1 Tax=Sporosarcina sp. 179-K 3D1 HS TaxID=3232169 RepID=UPI0039A1D00B
MIATIRENANGYVAQFERHLPHPVEEVWAWLTENDKLAQWFSELRAGDLRKGGSMVFDMQDGHLEELEITDFETGHVLEFSWWEDRVRFELIPELDGSRLVLKDEIARLTDHTPKDLAGWHVCLDVICALADGENIDHRNDDWKIWYEKYTQAIEEIKHQAT